MTAIGETLRRERLKRNLDLEQVSHELKISSKFLEAIEEERFDVLPRGVFAKSFVRQYARLLGLDEDELAGEVQRAVEPPSAPHFAQQSSGPPAAEIRVPRMEAWQTVTDSRLSRPSSTLPALALVVVVMLVCSGVYALWQRSRHAPAQHEDSAAASQTAPVGNRLPHMEQAPSTETAKAQPPQQTPQPQQQTPQTNSADRPASENPSSAAKPATAVPAGPSPEPGTRVQIPGANPHGPVQVAVTADELVWVMVKADGKVVFSGTMDAKTTHSFDGTENILVRLGNAGGVSIKLNGQPVGSVGPRGQVRSVQFTSGGFQIVAPPKPSLPPEALL